MDACNPPGHQFTFAFYYCDRRMGKLQPESSSRFFFPESEVETIKRNAATLVPLPKQFTSPRQDAVGVRETSET